MKRLALILFAVAAGALIAHVTMKDRQARPAGSEESDTAGNKHPGTTTPPAGPLMLYDRINRHPTLSTPFDRSGIQEQEWMEAIDTASRHMGGFLHQYTLIRIIVPDAGPDEIITARFTKIKKLTPEYDGGGGAGADIRNGEILFIQHINSSERREGFDPLVLTSPSIGEKKVWIPVPPHGEIGIAGDLVIE